MSICNHSIKVSRTAHYYTYGTLSKETKYISFALHGYGQLASKMVKKFKFLNPQTHYVVAPEGLNSFYWHGNNEPVACWMTRKDRYDEINDFNSYLDELYQRTAANVDQSVVKTIMGFSQGCATMWRWMHGRQPSFDVMINWGGWIPEDISYLHLRNYLRDRQIHVVYGDSDEFLTDSIVGQMKTLIKRNQLKAQTRVFKGGHRIPADELEKFYDEHVLTYSPGTH